MKNDGYKFIAVGMMVLFIFACSPAKVEKKNHDHYRSLSALTDPGIYSEMLGSLPDDVTGICEIAKKQSVHQNLLPYFGVPRDKWGDMKRIRPPKMAAVLKALKDNPPHHLYGERDIRQRVVGACISESHFLAGLLRHKNIPARVRAGYFKDVRSNGPYVVKFWNHTLKEKGINADLLKQDPEQWNKNIDAFTAGKNEINHHIEHWVCEYWDEDKKKWRLLDANDTFLKAASNIEVGFHLPRKHYEYAFEAWKKMRRGGDFNPDRYAEEPQDGRSHIRSQMLWDFYSLLNHDLAGHDQQWPGVRTFIKEKNYRDLSALELEELNLLADVLSKQPTKDDLVALYLSSQTMRIESAENDRYSFVYKK
jgi:hypothetical protein